MVLKSSTKSFEESKIFSEDIEVLKKHYDFSSNKTTILNTDNKFEIEKLEHDCIINLMKLNDIRYINKFIEHCNNSLKFDGVLVCCFQSLDQRKGISFKNLIIINYILSILSYIFWRVFPKLSFFKKIYFFVTKGKNRALSKVEVLGRLISCGFEIESDIRINGLTYIISKKKFLPKFDYDASYGPIFKMKRVGKDAKIINVYKIRTMHPYSEYLHDYMLSNFGSETGDKINNDIRVTKLGRFFRKYWIDETPMLINLLKGDIKLVGVRPLSKSKFKLYDKRAQLIRTKIKPGLIPPFYADMPKNFTELVDSEISYVNKYLKNPITTDFKYFVKAFVNIVVKGKRSK